jgi:ATP-dependent DNA ligase
VIAGYTPSLKNFDALVIGFCEGDRLVYAARTRSGFNSRIESGIVQEDQAAGNQGMPFRELARKRAGRWGAGLTAAKMVECRWLKPQFVGQFEFVEWTSDGHLRHSKSMGLREDRKAKNVRRE